MNAAQLRLRIAKKRRLAADIAVFELRAMPGMTLPRFEPGAHINVTAPSGAVRSYSLCNDPAETDRYVIAVKRDDRGRGGSISMVDSAMEGTEIAASGPANHFPLVEAKRFLLIAGGIGITPILSMSRSLAGRGSKDFRLIYCTRTWEATAFADELTAIDLSNRIIFHHDDGDPRKAYDFWPHFKVPSDMQIYCCGPAPLMDHVRDLTAHWPRRLVHFEDFSGVKPVEGGSQPFQVIRAATGQAYDVPSDKTVLEVLRHAGFMLPSSCESGTCGTCRVRLISGTPVHRDLILEPLERREFFMPCVSRAEGNLVIDF
jgi:phthalate 4,5-dioxygenase reductase subunit